MQERERREAALARATGRQAKALRLLYDLLDVDQGMTDWEIDRVEEWAALVEEGGRLTSRQMAKLVEIHRQRT